MFFSFFLCICGVFLGLNYCKMANQGLRTSSNIFWIIFAASKVFTKSGPSDPLFITKALQTIQEKSRVSLKHIIFTYINISQIQNVQIFGHYRTSNTWKLCLVLCGPKTIVSSQGFKKNGILLWWNLAKCWNSENLQT